MLALGASPGSVCGLILLECIFLALLSIFIGVVVGSIFVVYFGHVGFTVPGSEEMMMEWNMPAVLYPRINLATLCTGPVIVLITTLLATAYPVVHIFKLNPVEAMKAT